MRLLLNSQDRMRRSVVIDAPGNDGEGIAPAADQAAREDIRVVAQFFDRGLNAAARGFADLALVIDDAGDGLDRHLRVFGDIAESHVQGMRFTSAGFGHIHWPV